MRRQLLHALAAAMVVCLFSTRGASARGCQLVVGDTLTRVVALTPTVGQRPLRGDVNHDGKVTVGDVTALVEIILGQTSPAPTDGEEDQAGRADINRDQHITIADVTALVNIILGKASPELPFDPGDDTDEALAKPGNWEMEN